MAATIPRSSNFSALLWTFPFFCDTIQARRLSLAVCLLRGLKRKCAPWTLFDLTSQ